MAMTQALEFSHEGWNAYYAEHRGERAWNGIPDEFLMEHIDDVLVPGATNIIDVAAGDGRNSEPFLQRGLNVLATDLSPVALATFAERCRIADCRKPVLLTGDFLSLDLVPNQFDCAVCFNSIPHFESPALALDKIVSVLRHGGRAAFNAFTPCDVAYGQGQKVGIKKFCYRDTLFSFMTEDDVKQIMPLQAAIIHCETRKWQEPDHGAYRRGTHTHEACFFIIEKKEYGRG
jgi:SAM-dependent methyltransferase